MQALKFSETGYWIVDIEEGEPFVAGGWTYLTRVLQWAKQAGFGAWQRGFRHFMVIWLKCCRLSAIIDLHGAPGSQNGDDDSGFAGPILW